MAYPCCEHCEHMDQEASHKVACSAGCNILGRMD